MHEFFRRDAITRCPACDYDLSGAVNPTCPECGYTVAASDVDSDVSRRVFLQLTLVPVLIRASVLALLALILWGAPLVLVGQSIAAGLYLVKARQGLQRRMVFRAWSLAAVWLQLMWIVPVTVSIIWDWVYWETSLLDWYGEFEMGGYVGMLALGGVLAPVLWWASWRRSCRVLCIPREEWFDRRVRRSLAIAYAPQAVILVLAGSLNGLLSILDRQWPGWYLDWLR